MCTNHFVVCLYGYPLYSTHMYLLVYVCVCSVRMELAYSAQALRLIHQTVHILGWPLRYFVYPCLLNLPEIISSTCIILRKLKFYYYTYISTCVHMSLQGCSKQGKLSVYLPTYVPPYLRIWYLCTTLCILYAIL